MTTHYKFASYKESKERMIERNEKEKKKLLKHYIPCNVTLYLIVSLIEFSFIPSTNP